MEFKQPAKPMDARQLFQLLARDIEKGVFATGSQLPSQAALMAQYNLSRHAVRKALGMLVEQKYVTSWQGSGAIVRGHEWSYPITKRTRIHQSLKESGAKIDIKILRVLEKKRPPADIANLFNLSMRERLPFIEFLITTDDLPIALGQHFIGLDVDKNILKQVQELGEIVAAYAAIGISDYTRKRTTVRVRMPSEREKGLLQIPHQQPLFVLSGLNVDESGKALEVTEAIVRGDRIKLDI